MALTENCIAWVNGLANYRVRPVEEGELQGLLCRLDRTDIRELHAWASTSPNPPLVETERLSSTKLAVEAPGGGVFYFGVVPRSQSNLDIRLGQIWMLPDVLARKHLVKLGGSLALTRTARRIVRMAQQEFDVLYNYIDIRNVVVARWLEALGFEIRTETKVERGGVAFVPFYRARTYTPSEEHEVMQKYRAFEETPVNVKALQ